jgi:TRAP-type C4-dicarboxylate transport system substrate-binding protein
MKRIFISVAALAIVFQFSAIKPVNAETKIIFNNFTPPKFIITPGIINPWIKEINEALAGEVVFKVPAKSLGAPPRQKDIITQGIADGAFIFNAFLSNSVPHLKFSIMPKMSTTAEADGVALWRTYQKYFAPKNAFKDVHLLSFFDGPGGDIFTMQDKPIRTVEDIKNMKLWTLPFSLSQMLKQLNVAVVPGPAVRIYPIVSKKTVDGFVGLDMYAIYGFNVAQFVKSATHVEGYVYNPTFSVMLSKKKWNGFSKKARDTITKLSGERLSRRAKTWDDVVNKSKAKYLASGKKYYQADKSLNDAVSKISEGMVAGWIKQMKGLGIDGKAAIAFFRQSQKDYLAGR